MKHLLIAVLFLAGCKESHTPQLEVRQPIITINPNEVSNTKIAIQSYDVEYIAQLYGRVEGIDIAYRLTGDSRLITLLDSIRLDARKQIDSIRKIRR